MESLGVPVAAYIPYDDSVAMADMMGKAPIDYDPGSQAVKALSELIDFLNKRYDF
jgi:CO dehydrogenase nickel-insertion accessory protein CooC1